MELQTAKEILAEVFRVRISVVDEMIQNRFEAAGKDDMDPKESGPWPAEFWLEEVPISRTATYFSLFFQVLVRAQIELYLLFLKMYVLHPQKY